MSKIKYQIYSGAGNDFVMINNWDNAVPFDDQKQLTSDICENDFKNIDGVIFLDKPAGGGAIRMNYYNRNGSFGAMCGNGARCTARFAFAEGIISTKSFMLEAVDKNYKVDLIGDDMAKLYFPDNYEFKLNLEIDTGSSLELSKIHWVYVGSEHLIVFIDDIRNPKVNSLDEIDIQKTGSTLRYHKDYQPKGANVNFIQLINKDSGQIRIRTYERGVERETLACGTGIVSSALVSNLILGMKSPVKILVQSGEELEVEFRSNDKIISGVSLFGSARKTGEGELQT